MNKTEDLRNPYYLGTPNTMQPAQGKEESMLQNFVNQFERANDEQNKHCDRLRILMEGLNQTVNVVMEDERPKRGRLTSGEGLLSRFENLLANYQEMVQHQSYAISELERYIKYQ